MRFGHIQILILASIALCMVNSMHLHDQIIYDASYATALNNTQKLFQTDLQTIVEKLKFISTTLKQVTPQASHNITAISPTLLTYIS